VLGIGSLSFVEIIEERATNINLVIAIELKVSLVSISILYSLRAMLYLWKYLIVSLFANSKSNRRASRASGLPAS